MYIELFGKKIFESGFGERGKSTVASHTLGGYTPEKPYDKGKIDLRTLRKIVLKEPLLYKAIWKKNKDTFKEWFEIKDIDDEEPIKGNDKKIIKNFNRKTDFKHVLTQAGYSANIYGTAFIEKLYDEHGNIKSSTDPKDSEGNNKNPFIDIKLLDSEKIQRIKEHPKKDDDLLYYVYNDPKTGKQKFIHPNRIKKIVIDKLPNNEFGISKPFILLNILKSKMNFDVSSGEYLDWAGVGFFDVMIENMSDKQKKDAEKKFKEHPDVVVHDETYEIDSKNPKSLDPQHFIDYFYVNISACLEMPKHMLTGSEMGNITGSEVGLSSYYGDIENIQKLIFTPVIEDIYSEWFESHDKEWNYELDWNEIFVDELSEAKILQTRAYSAVQCVNSNTPIISVEEARKVLRDGHVEFVPEDVPDKGDDEGEDMPDPNIEPQPTTKPEKNEFKPLTPMQKRMIEVEKELGKREIEKQEKRVNEAEKE